MRKFYLYVITSPSGKQYVGKTCDRDRRFKDHAKADKRTALAQAFLKYGADAMQMRVLLWTRSEEKCLLAEKRFIKKLNTLSPNGYNLTAGGLGAIGYKPSVETLAKLSVALRNPSAETRAKLSAVWLGKQRPLKTRKKMSAAQRQRYMQKPMSATTRAKLSAALVNPSPARRAIAGAANLGRKLSAAHRAAIGAAHCGKKRSPEARENMQRAQQQRRAKQKQLLERRI